jgi:hypothetical protein
MGPVCVYWSYPMERYCSFVGAAVKSRRFPYANIARRLLDVAQLRTAREIYNLHSSITFGQTRASTEGDKAIELAEADRIMSRECEYPISCCDLIRISFQMNIYFFLPPAPNHSLSLPRSETRSTSTLRPRLELQ